MRILAFSDIHRNKEFARELVSESASGDILIGAGDFGTGGEGTADTIEILKQVSVPTIIVPGNHDDVALLEQLCRGWKLGHFLHGKVIMIGGVSFFGLGCEIPKYNSSSWNVSLTEENADALLSSADDYDVLITHTPPKGHVDVEFDDDHQGGHDGSESILKAVQLRQPVLHFCGHMHDSWGQSSKLGTTSVHNLGPTINWFEIEQ